MRNPLPGVRIPFEQPRPIVIDSQLKFLTLEDILLERPIVFTTCCEGSTRWEDALRKVREMNGDLVTCQKDEAGRYEYPIVSLSYGCTTPVSELNFFLCSFSSSLRLALIVATTGGYLNINTLCNALLHFDTAPPFLSIFCERVQ